MTALQRHLGAGIVVGVMAVACLAGGCATSDRDDTPPFDGSLAFSQASGLYKDVTTIYIDATGTMTLTKPGGDMMTMVLPAASMTELRDKVDQAQFFTLQAEYLCGCHAGVVDNISVQIVGTWHTVIVESSSDSPARLKPLRDMLWSLVMSSAGRE